MIDAHLHLCDLQRSAYSWITPELGPLHTTITAERAAGELAAVGVERAVLVQAEDSVADTAYLLDVAARSSFVAGVVGWIRLYDPRTAERQLADHGDRLCGVRHLVHDDPRDDFLDLPEVRRSLALVAAQGLALDVPDAWPRHLGAVARLADALPELTVVVDHLGKPPRDPADRPAWELQLREAAERPNVLAKLSGLQTPGVPFTEAAVRPLVDLALEVFGADRLMYGGDWPMTVPSGGYADCWAVVRTLLWEQSIDVQDAVLHRTADTVYRLGAGGTSDQ